jgi:hypothetical protein
MRLRLGAPLLPLLLAPGLLGSDLDAQVNPLPTRVQPRLAAPAEVPFGPGEFLQYDVRLGALGRRGEGHMEVLSLDSIRGHTMYHVAMSIEGGLLFAKVKDHYQSWFDVQNLVTYRFIQDVDEINYERYRHWELFPEERRWERPDNGNSGDLPTDQPLDDVSFMYYVRTLPLEVGDEYVFNRYFRENGNPVVIRVLRKDTVTVPAGTFETVVVQPIIQTDGLFSEGGEAELYFTTDERRLMVYMRSKVHLIGSLSLHLTEIQEGSPLRVPGAGKGEDAGGLEPSKPAQGHGVRPAAPLPICPRNDPKRFP